MTPDTRTTENPEPRTPTGKEFAESLRNHDTPHPMAGKRRPINEWIAAIEAEAAQGAAPRAEGHTQDCINAFYGDGGQSGCICEAERCSWTIRCKGESDHSGPHHSKDRFAAPRAEGLRRGDAMPSGQIVEHDYGAAPRAEGLDDVDVLRECHRLLTVAGFRSAAARLARLSERRDKEGTE